MVLSLRFKGKRKKVFPLLVLIILFLAIILIGLLFTFPIGNFAAQRSQCSTFIRGDTNSDGEVDYSDHMLLSEFISGKTISIKCFDAADIDDNGVVNFVDPPLLKSYLDGNGNPPTSPFPNPGPDEACDGVDNDMDSIIDEGCSVCIDNDADSVCSTEDQDDNDPNVH